MTRMEMDQNHCHVGYEILRIVGLMMASWLANDEKSILLTTFKFIKVMMNCLGFNGQQGMFLTSTAVWIIKKIGLLFYKPCQSHPYNLMFFGGSKDGDVGNGDFGVPSVFQ